MFNYLGHKQLSIYERCRVRYYLRKMTTGCRVSILPPVVVAKPRNITLGDDVRINAGCTLQAHAPIEIGSLTMIAAGVTIVTANHDLAKRGIEAFNTLRPEPVRIGSNVWLGAGVIVLPGVTIGDGCVVGAGSVVTGDLPPEMICFGVPARAVRPRPTEESNAE
jgi:acetyltransferase-like isoleucine patch superfamily enzyme